MCESVTRDILEEKKNLLKLTDLLDTYVNALEDTAFTNPEYRGSKLKVILQNKFKEEIPFCKLDLKGKYKNVYVTGCFQRKHNIRNSSPVPFSIGTTDGYLAKTDKSKGLKYLSEGLDLANIPAQTENFLVIEDGNALFL